MIANITIVIPTYGREGVLLTTIERLLKYHRVGELLVVDQTPSHERETERQLQEWDSTRAVRWIRLEQPSIPHAMNIGLQEAKGEVVLFLDDDIEPDEGLVAAHAAAHERYPDAWAVVGQVLQPGEEPGGRNGYVSRRGLRADLGFPFWSDEPAWVSNVMAGNLSVKREAALACGGFDENFQGAAYRFETEFARRLIRQGGKILFEPAASIRHLRAERGGTRSQGSHQGSASPIHGMGDYYFAMRQDWNWETAAYMARRPLREVCTRFHARRPWLIPVKLLGELRAFLWAWELSRQEPALIANATSPALAESAAEFEPSVTK